MNMSINSLQMLKLGELITTIGLSRSAIYDRMNPKSKRYDPHFPTPLKIGRSVRWLLSEVQTWINHQTSIRNSSNVS